MAQKPGTALAFFILILGASATEAAPASNPSTDRSSKPAWEWSDEERIAVRFDPTSIQERASREATEPYGVSPPVNSQKSDRMRSQAAGETPNLIIGQRNPELLMPFELFNFLIRDGFSNDLKERAEYRRNLEPIISRSIKPDVFWTAVEAEAAFFIENQREESHLLSQLKPAPSDDARAAIRQQIRNLQQPQCHQRATALTAVAKRIGQRTLYRVLYEGVAPTVTTTSTGNDVAVALRAAAGGC